jgi:recombinational DNA repair protein (RecF pathway)
MTHPTPCADCGAPANGPPGPPTGWELEDGRIVCHECCVVDFRATVRAAQFSRTLRHFRDTNP